MRGNFSHMLGASLALHICLTSGFALSYFHVPSPPPQEISNATAPTVLLLRSVASSAPVKTPIASANPSHAIASAPAATVPAAESLPPAPPQLALEANPNANVRALPPESVLSPSPAPQLNSANGVVFILDVSGSMYEPYSGTTRLALARQALCQRILALKDGTPFAITLYAKSACNSGPLVAANNDTRAAAIRYIMRDVDCGGGTNLPAGLASAVQLQTGSLVLISDGDWNMSAATIMAQSGSILGPQGHCPSLTIIGIAPRFSAGAVPLMQDLADQQGGTYATAQPDGTPELVTSAANLTKPASTAP